MSLFEEITGSELSRMGYQDIIEHRYAPINDFMLISSLIGNIPEPVRRITPDNDHSFFLSKLAIDEINRNYLMRPDVERDAGFEQLYHDLSEALMDKPAALNKETLVSVDIGTGYEIHIEMGVWDWAMGIFLYDKQNKRVYLSMFSSMSDDFDKILRINQIQRGLSHLSTDELLAELHLNEKQLSLVKALKTHGRLFLYKGGFWSVQNAQMTEITKGSSKGKLAPEWHFKTTTVRALINRGVIHVAKWSINSKGCDEEIEITLSDDYRTN